MQRTLHDFLGPCHGDAVDLIQRQLVPFRLDFNRRPLTQRHGVHGGFQAGGGLVS